LGCIEATPYDLQAICETHQGDEIEPGEVVAKYRYILFAPTSGKVNQAFEGSLGKVIFALVLSALD
jgi:hypothetical protein